MWHGGNWWMLDEHLLSLGHGSFPAPIAIVSTTRIFVSCFHIPNTDDDIPDGGLAAWLVVFGIATFHFFDAAFTKTRGSRECVIPIAREFIELFPSPCSVHNKLGTATSTHEVYIPLFYQKQYPKGPSSLKGSR
jgi:hypothetical protein